MCFCYAMTPCYNPVNFDLFKVKIRIEMVQQQSQQGNDSLVPKFILTHS